MCRDIKSRNNILNALLVELDGIAEQDKQSDGKAKKGGKNKKNGAGGNNHGHIVVFGATNRAEMLDEALTRSGRLERTVRFNTP